MLPGSHRFTFPATCCQPSAIRFQPEELEAEGLPPTARITRGRTVLRLEHNAISGSQGHPFMNWELGGGVILASAGPLEVAGLLEGPGASMARRSSVCPRRRSGRRRR